MQSQMMLLRFDVFPVNDLTEVVDDGYFGFVDGLVVVMNREVTVAWVGENHNTRRLRHILNIDDYTGFTIYQRIAYFKARKPKGRVVECHPSGLEQTCVTADPLYPNHGIQIPVSATGIRPPRFFNPIRVPYFSCLSVVERDQPNAVNPTRYLYVKVKIKNLDCIAGFRVEIVQEPLDVALS